MDIVRSIDTSSTSIAHKYETNAISSRPLCFPSRSCFFSGFYVVEVLLQLRVKKKKKRRDVDGFLTISSQLAPRKKSPTEICGFSGNFSAGKNARVRDFPRASSFFSAKFLDTLLRDQRSRMTDGVDTSMIERFVFSFLLEIIGKLVW